MECIQRRTPLGIPFESGVGKMPLFPLLAYFLQQAVGLIFVSFTLNYML
jgi:hypothetical protein